jgi:hypothetical protein
MIAFNRRTHIYVAKGPTDMRASYDTLFLKVRDTQGLRAKSLVKSALCTHNAVLRFAVA